MLEPFNRHILIMPEHVKKDKIVKGEQILVDRSMIEEIEYGGDKHYLILDNYVIAKLKENKE